MRPPNNHELQVLHELDRQLGAPPCSTTVTANTIGDAIDLDAREMVDALGGLFFLDLAKEVDRPDAFSSDQFTLEPIELTKNGDRFLDR